MSAPAPAAFPDLTRRQRLAAMAVVAGLCLSFAAFTGHMWEDYFITFRASLHLAAGDGLVFQPGERVQTFTSPLGTLLPAVFAWGGGETVAIRALWLFRIVSSVLLALALVGAARTLVRDGLRLGLVAGVLAAWAFDPKTVDFSINGMETALLIFFIVATWRALHAGGALWPTAAAFAGLQWTRPDGVVFSAALVVGWLVFGPSATGLRRAAQFQRVVRAALVGLALYLPWLAWSAWYYGTPVPHTILAKVSPHSPGDLGPALLLYPWRLLVGHTTLHDVFMPAYFYFGGWPAVVGWVARIVAVVAALAWVWPRVLPAGRVASFAFFLGGYYVEFIPRSPWYYPGWQALAFLAWAYLLSAALASTRGHGSVGASVLRCAGGVLVVLQVALLACVAWQMRVQQTIVESGQRTAIGRWLRTQAGPTDRVYLEPLGYIGYYSGLKMLDYPGLASPEVVAARRAGHRPDAGLIQELRPEWLVLRPDQVQRIEQEQPRLLPDSYQLSRVFDCAAEIAGHRFLPGRAYLEFDSRFLVFHRLGAGTPTR